jgi:hypothetical protein
VTAIPEQIAWLAVGLVPIERSASINIDDGQPDTSLATKLVIPPPDENALRPVFIPRRMSS